MLMKVTARQSVGNDDRAVAVSRRIGSQPWTETLADSDVKTNFSTDADVVPSDRTGASQRKAIERQSQNS